MTDFPKQGDDLKISLRNSERPQFDHAYAQRIKDDHPQIWKAGGNIRGNEAFTLWSRARDGEETEGVLDWIKEREAWAARHAGDGSQFPEASPTLSSVAGVVAAMKWGVILDIGEGIMKEAITELINKQERTMTDETKEAHELKHEELKVERRYLSINVESRDEEEGDGKTVEGYAAVFNTDADLGGFTERIDPGAFDAALKDPQLDVAALFNHDQNQILARNRGGQGNLELWTDDKGLKYRFKLGDQSYAQDLAINLRMGLVNQSSFAFSIKEDDWSMRDGRDHRTIKAVNLHDISPVVFPAYSEATASIRSQEQEQPNHEPAVTSSRDRAQAQLAIYNLTK